MGLTIGSRYASSPPPDVGSLALLPVLAGVLILVLGVGLTAGGIAVFNEVPRARRATGILAGVLFGVAAIGFRGGIINLPEGSFLIRASTILVVSLALQSAMLLAWLAVFDRRAITASFGVWRTSILAGFLGAFASQFWFIGFSLT